MHKTAIYEEVRGRWMLAWTAEDDGIDKATVGIVWAGQIWLGPGVLDGRTISTTVSHATGIGS